MKTVRVTRLFSINTGKLEVVFNTDLNLHSSIGNKEPEFRELIYEQLGELEGKLRKLLGAKQDD